MIAWRRGSVREVVEAGVTGYVVDEVPGAVQAFDRFRQGCHRAFELRFDAARMAADYVDVYQKVISVG